MSIQGVVQKVFFEDEDFYIFRLEDDNGDKQKAKGSFPHTDIRPGIELKLRGDWYNHPKYGPTFQIEDGHVLFQHEDPTVKWLWSHLSELRPSQARTLVSETSPRKAIDLLKSEGEDFLQEHLDVNEDSAEDIASEFSRTYSLSRNSTVLMDLGVPSHLIKPTFKALGDRADKRIKEDPYCLMDVRGFPFEKVDTIARRTTSDRDGRARKKAVICYILERSQKMGGDLFLWKSSLINEVNQLSNINIPSFTTIIDEEEFNDLLQELYEEDKIMRNKERIYLQDNFYLEYYSAEKLNELFENQSTLDVDMDEFLDDYRETYDIELSDKQTEVVRAMKDEQVVLVTGLPGTGKTTVIRALSRLFRHIDMKFDLMSPTGIAAKKLSSVTGEEAGTIHRILGYDGKSWAYDHNQKYDTEAVIVDECSMLDQELFYHLITSLKSDTRLVLVGDPAQLPSVGAGNVIHELIECGGIHRVHLDKIFRRDDASDITINAHDINSGSMPDLKDPREDDTDFRFIKCDDPSRIRESIVSLTGKLYRETSNDFTFQTLSPTYHGDIGVDALNESIKREINPPGGKLEKNLGSQSFREDDRVMVTQNHYGLGVYNGETGKVQTIDRDEEVIRVKIFSYPADKVVDIDFQTAAGLLKLAYAMTIHKSQGQEFNAVVFPFHKTFGGQLQRNLLYTAVTRAQDKVFIFGQRRALRDAIDNNRVELRNSRLSHWTNKI